MSDYTSFDVDTAMYWAEAALSRNCTHATSREVAIQLQEACAAITQLRMLLKEERDYVKDLLEYEEPFYGEYGPEYGRYE